MKTKIWILVGVVLAVIGLALFAAAMTENHWNFTALDTGNFKTAEYEFGETFRDITITVTEADVVFAPAEGEKCRVVVYEREDEPHTVTVSDGTLSVTSNDERKWFDHVGISVKEPKVTVYLPESEYGALTVRGATGSVLLPPDFRLESADISFTTGDTTVNAPVSGALKVASTTGDITLDGITAKEIELSVTTGEIKLSEVTCENTVKITVTTGETEVQDLTCAVFESDGSTGDITLKNVTATETITVERSTGDVKLVDSDAPALMLKTTTGSITGTLLTDKIYTAKTSTGTITVPDSRPGGTCEIRTSTGDICFR